ncbi:hypothetical protein BO86DRAFT_433192 [Aspergillus japonicus CBS 114.51]|uniref:F-box domain-containing protein n=1 Tax=Aspergillus japonicus CBS 114.51 TaxID=1448312 RepID=A0A8T8WXF1_ASPJA|nr:hypothetical protein BO86DRAFT_433192 [Aspergillus japonicus CBS 114.51]RAH80491.1 hypothetical protein BO86DRAFT_433192 [Aspergillus japonicus CBS 114.51]
MRSKSRQTSGILACPTEIFRLIFKSLSRTELRLLCLVHKILRAHAEPLLYGGIFWIWRKPHSPPIPLLLRTILRRPQLAAHIKSFHLDMTAFHEYHPDVGRYIIHDHPFVDELDEHIAFIRRTGVSHRRSWIRKLRQGTTDAFLALLLAQLSSLRSWHISGVVTRHSNLVGLTLVSAICESGRYQLPNFQHLREVNSHFMPRSNRRKAGREPRKSLPWHATNILPFLYLPDLECLSVSLGSPIVWPTPHLPASSKLRSLDLGQVHEADLGEILSVTPNLDTLHWYWSYPTDVVDGVNTSTLDRGQLVAALLQVRNTLRELTIEAVALLPGARRFPRSLLFKDT